MLTKKLGFFLKHRVSEIRVNQIRVNQGLGVINLFIFFARSLTLGDMKQTIRFHKQFWKIN